MEESLRALIEGALAAQARADIAHQQLIVAERAHSEAMSQLRTEVANLDHALANRIAIYGDSVVRLSLTDRYMNIKEVVLIPLVQVLKAAPPTTPPVEQPAIPKSQPAPPPNTVPPPSHGTSPPRTGKR